jgi:glycosyltransferase involved in cell wall biosynthesis
MMEVSIITITYNQKEFVNDTIDSCLKQTFDKDKYEIIISDDGSTDGTQEIIQEYANKYKNIVPLLSKENTGIANNANRALAVAKGKYLALLSGDDIMLPKKIETQVEYLKKNDDVIGCSHDMEVFNSETNQKIAKSSELLCSRKIPNKMGIEFFFDHSIALIPSAMMMKRAYVPKNGFNTHLKYANDYLFDIEVFVQGKLGYIDQVHGRYRKHDQQVSNISKKEEDFEESMVVFGIVLARYPQLYKLVTKHKSSMILSNIVHAIKTGKRERALSLSKYLIINGHYIKGFFGFLIIIFLTKKMIEAVYKSKKFTNIKFFWRKYIL